MSLESALGEGLNEGLKKAAPQLSDMVLDALWSHTWFPFIVGGQARLIETGMEPRKAWQLARSVLVEYVKSEKLTFGDPAFDWGPQGGRDVVQECEIDHWDARP